MSGFQMGKREKWRRGEKGPFNSLEVTLARGEGLATSGEVQQPLPALCTCVIKSSNQQSERDHWYLEDESSLSSLVPTAYTWAAPGTCAQLPATEGGIAGTVLRAEIDGNEPSFTIQLFPLRLQAFNRLQSSKIVTSDRFYQCNYVGGRQIPGAPYSIILPDFWSRHFWRLLYWHFINGN